MDHGTGDRDVVPRLQENARVYDGFQINWQTPEVSMADWLKVFNASGRHGSDS